jgi:3-vinyl bacteriochlorophyllide hydratase
LFGTLHARYQMYIALLAYSAYLINATQFIVKLRKARLEGDTKAAPPITGDAASGQVAATGLGL